MTQAPVVEYGAVSLSQFIPGTFSPMTTVGVFVTDVNGGLCDDIVTIHDVIVSKRCLTVLQNYVMVAGRDVRLLDWDVPDWKDDAVVCDTV